VGGAVAAGAGGAVADEDGDGGANRPPSQANLYQIDMAEEHDTSGIAHEST
jgi:hypothetical protein